MFVKCRCFLLSSFYVMELLRRWCLVLFICNLLMCCLKSLVISICVWLSVRWWWIVMYWIICSILLKVVIIKVKNWLNVGIKMVVCYMRLRYVSFRFYFLNRWRWCNVWKKNIWICGYIFISVKIKMKLFGWNRFILIMMVIWMFIISMVWSVKIVFLFIVFISKKKSGIVSVKLNLVLFFVWFLIFISVAVYLIWKKYGRRKLKWVWEWISVLELFLICCKCWMKFIKYCNYKVIVFRYMKCFIWLCSVEWNFWVLTIWLVIFYLVKRLILWWWNLSLFRYSSCVMIILFF